MLKTVGGRSQGPIVRRPAAAAARAGSAAPRARTTARPSRELLAELGRRAGLVGEARRRRQLHPHVPAPHVRDAAARPGVPLAAVQDAARHAASETTRLYDRARTAFREHPTHKLDF